MLQKNRRWIVLAVSTAIIVALLAAYAFFGNPDIFKPTEIEITGTVTAAGATADTIAFTNTACGTRNEAQISTSGTYEISLENEFTYNVSVAYTDSGGTNAEKAAGTLVLDSTEKTLTRNWTIQP